MNPQVDQFLSDGCGRCDLFATPQCKVHFWTHELQALREIILQTGLKEEVKWGVPCYTLNGKNIALIVALKNYCGISFFKGVLLKDEQRLLVSPGKNSLHDRQFRFTKLEEIIPLESAIKSYLHEAIEVERLGLKVPKTASKSIPYPEELTVIFKENPEVKAAFVSLTPGRQRGYLLHFTGAKQSKTIKSRIDKNIPRILIGKGIHDR